MTAGNTNVNTTNTNSHINNEMTEIAFSWENSSIIAGDMFGIVFSLTYLVIMANLSPILFLLMFWNENIMFAYFVLYFHLVVSRQHFETVFLILPYTLCFTLTLTLWNYMSNGKYTIYVNS